MSNMISYAEQQILPFEEKPFCPVDSLILSWFSYFQWPAAAEQVRGWAGVRLADLFRAEWFPDLFHHVWDPDSSRRLFAAAAASPRFRDIRLMGYTQQADPVEEKQFAAVTLRLAPELYYFAFRGTDSTLLGWKEDFNMAFRCPVSSQLAAVSYLEEAAGHCGGAWLLGGHSKGGNLAVYSAANCGEVFQARISRVFSHDGPGFLESVLESPGFLRIEPKIEKTLPQSSVIGMLLEQQEHFQVIESDRFSFWQHDPFSWLVEGDCFRPMDRLTPDARYLDQALNQWVRCIPEADRARFVDTLYAVLTVTDVSTFAELRADWRKTVPAVMQAASALDPDTKEFLFRVLKESAALSVGHVPHALRKEEVPNAELRGT